MARRVLGYSTVEESFAGWLQRQTNSAEKMPGDFHNLRDTGISHVWTRPQQISCNVPAKSAYPPEIPQQVAFRTSTASSSRVSFMWMTKEELPTHDTWEVWSQLSQLKGLSENLGKKHRGKKKHDVFIDTYIYIYICVYIYIYMCVDKYIYICVLVNTYVYIYIHYKIHTAYEGGA